MPIYNSAKYLRTAIDSVLNQTLQDFEFIIIDDGSTDETGSVLSEAANDSRIKIIYQQNMGVTKSLNKGIALSCGNYIARQDADDISLPTRLETQVDFLETFPDYGLVGCLAEVINERGEPLRLMELLIEDDEIRGFIMRRNCFCHGAVMMRRSSLDKVGVYRDEFALAQDYDLWLRIIEAFKVANLPGVMYQYREHEHSISHNQPGLQHAYVRIARELANERRAGECDLLTREGGPAFAARYGEYLDSKGKAC